MIYLVVFVSFVSGGMFEFAMERRRARRRIEDR